MLIFFENRHVLMSHMPKNCKIAEIGVREGHNAKWLLKTNPEKLHLIDPWTHTDDEEYVSDYHANAEQAAQDKRFAGVNEYFKNEIESGQVIVHRQTSTEALQEFPDEYFDWVFLDAMHYYNAVYDDIINLLPKLKKDGVIIGHDFCEHEKAAQYNFGVIGAVNAIIKRTESQLFGINIHLPCDDSNIFPCFFLSKEKDGALSKRIIESLVTKKLDFLEIPEELAWTFSYKKLHDRWYPSFSHD